MTDSISDRINRFNEGDDPNEKIELLLELEYESSPQVMDLFVRAVGDPAENELVRIEILKILPLRIDLRESEHYERAGRTVSRILVGESEEEYLVRQYAAKALRAFVAVEGVIPQLESVVRSEEADIDVRYNALAALEHNVADPKSRAALERLRNVPEFSKSITDTLDGPP